MDPFLEIAYRNFVSLPPKLVMGVSYSMLGFIVIGAIFCLYQRVIKRQRISVRSLFKDVFPAGTFSGFSPRVDIAIFFTNIFLMVPVARFVLAVLTVAIGASALDLLTATFGPRRQLISAVALVVAVQFLAYLLANELATYVIHRSFHRIPILWSIHRAHHSPESLNFFTGARDHPIEFLVNSLFRTPFSAAIMGLCAYLTGTAILPQTTVLVVFFMEIFFGFYQALSHSHMPISNFGRGNIILAAPVMHQMHHSAEEHMFDKNYGRIMHIYDWMFGTLYLPKRGEVYRLGLNEYEMGANNPHQTVRDLMVKPLVDVGTILKGKRIPFPTDNPRGSESGNFEPKLVHEPAE